MKKCKRCDKEFKPCNCGTNRFFNYRAIYCSKECFKEDYFEDKIKINSEEEEQI